jgi:transposase
MGFVRHAVKSSAKAALSAPEARPIVRRYRRTISPPDAAHRRAYPSDVTDAEWALVEPLVPAPKSGGRKAEHSRREIMNAIFYVLRSGCQWRMLPHDFPPWETVYDYFRRWRDGGVWEEINQSLREKVRQRAGREKTPSAVIIDSQSVKTTEKGGPVDMTGRSA